MNKQFYAHSLCDRPVEEWQVLEEHLKNVAGLAADFAKPFNAGEWAWLAGLWHDLGKYAPAFQARLLLENGIEAHLENNPGRVNHSSAGGLFAIKKLDPNRAKLLSYMIMGHHAGLTDYHSEHVGQASLEFRLRGELPSDVVQPLPKEMSERESPSQKIHGSPSFWLRMVFSCLVDADFLDTEAFMAPDRKAMRCVEYPSLDQLLTSFNDHMQRLSAGVPATPVNMVRDKVLEQCISAAHNDPGVFSLTVPTGGGKTLSSLAFALNHAVRSGNRKQRVIYVIPFTSIIEQTADVFRSIPGFEQSVVEHHSSIRDEHETPASRLAAENWDAPIIVTTAVQFFESLYACRPSRCRKLHNIAESVIIFDEAQCLPPDYLKPCVKAVRELCQNYGATALLCTATQPALKAMEGIDFSFSEGFENVQEIINEPKELFRQLKRVDVHLHSEWPRPVDWTTLASELSEHESVLCIVSRRDDCLALYGSMPSGTYHLSALMCGEHRSRIIAEIKERLKKAIPTRVISTQLVEAGVDLDFPVVYRAVAGLDSIAQAAGRCNREGRLRGFGKAVVFMAPSKPPRSLLSAAEIGSEVLERHISEPFAPEAVDEYFKQFFWMKGSERLDKHGILQLLPDNSLDFSFRTAADKFHLIDDVSRPVIVQYGDAVRLVSDLDNRPWEGRIILRKLQRYIVGINAPLHAELLRQGHIRELEKFPGVFVQETSGIYSQDTGLGVPDAVYDPGDLIG